MDKVVEEKMCAKFFRCCGVFNILLCHKEMKMTMIMGGGKEKRSFMEL